MTAWCGLASQSLTSSRATKAYKAAWQTLLVENPIGGVDTMIQGPRREFVMIIANRVVADQSILNAVQAISNLHKQIWSLEGEVKIVRGSIDNCLADNADLSLAIGVLREENADVKTFAHAQKGWATVGKVQTIIIVVAAIIVSVIVIKTEFTR